jgi:hypothetical protein
LETGHCLLETQDVERKGVAEKLDALKLCFSSSSTFFIPRFSNAREREGVGEEMGMGGRWKDGEDSHDLLSLKF